MCQKLLTNSAHKEYPTIRGFDRDPVLRPETSACVPILEEAAYKQLS